MVYIDFVALRVYIQKNKVKSSEYDANSGHFK